MRGVSNNHVSSVCKDRKDLKFDMKQVEAFRYRMEGAMKSDEVGDSGGESEGAEEGNHEFR